MTAPESCGCRPLGYDDIDTDDSACLYPATVERLKEAQAALARVPEMVPVALLLERNAEILRIGRLHAEANENADGLRARLRIAEEALAWIVTDAGYKAPEQRARAALASAPEEDDEKDSCALCEAEGAACPHLVDAPAEKIPCRCGTGVLCFAHLDAPAGHGEGEGE